MKTRKLIPGGDWLLLRRLTPTSRPTLRVLRRLSDTANDSKIWLAAAAVLAVTGRPRRRLAAEGPVAVAGASILLNGPLKQLVGRSRPHRPWTVGLHRTGRPPKTSSFPSGHAAAATAFATAVGLGSPLIGAPLGLVAATVGWSRVVLARNFPSDVLAGIAIGATCGAAAHAAGAFVADKSRANVDDEGETA